MDFSESSWASQEFAGHYLERAEIYVMERRRLLGLLDAITRTLFSDRRGLRVTDIGCGDGIVTSVLLGRDPSIRATLMDASDSMLAKAGRRLAGYSNCEFMRAGFDDIIDGSAKLPCADLVVSSMAIHHNEMPGKRALFGLILESLCDGGCFINVDTVKPTTPELERLYFSLWSEAMQAGFNRAGITDESPGDVIGRYTDPASQNRPDTLDDQIDALRSVGFENVDCYYKNGIFAIFGGQRPAINK